MHIVRQKPHAQAFAQMVGNILFYLLNVVFITVLAFALHIARVQQLGKQLVYIQRKAQFGRRIVALNAVENTKNQPFNMLGVAAFDQVAFVFFRFR